MMIETRLKELVANELDGEGAQRQVAEITKYHRHIGNAEYHEAAEYLKRYLKGIGLKVTSIDAPMDNETKVGNYILPYAWEPHDAILKVMSPEERTLVSFKEAPTCINSWSAPTPPKGVIAEVVHVGDGRYDADYAGKDARGKIVFVDKGYAWRTMGLTVEKYGALGIVNGDIREIPPEARLNDVASLAGEELMGVGRDEAAEVLHRRLDLLQYTLERDSQAIASTLVLARNEDEETRQLARAESQRLIQKLTDKAQDEEEELRSFAKFLHGDLSSFEPKPLPPEAALKPKMKRLGLIDMKRLTVELEESYERDIPGFAAGRRGFLGYIYEMCNLSNGERTLGEIARIIGHEVPPLDVEVYARMARDLERLGYMTVS